MFFGLMVFLYSHSSIRRRGFMDEAQISSQHTPPGDSARRMPCTSSVNAMCKLEECNASKYHGPDASVTFPSASECEQRWSNRETINHIICAR